MFGRKTREITELKAANLVHRGEIADLWQDIAAKNRQINLRNGDLKALGERRAADLAYIRQLNAQITELTRLLDVTREQTIRAEQAANAAIEAGGLLGDQVHAAETAIAQKDATINQLLSEAEGHKTTSLAMGEQMETLKREVRRLQEDNMRLQAIVDRAPDPLTHRVQLPMLRQRPQLEVDQDAAAIKRAVIEPDPTS